MTRPLGVLFLLACLAAALLSAESPGEAPVPATDRVGFPKDYQQKFQVLRAFNRKEEQKVITVFGNKLAASVTRTNDLPYPYGSIIVMETASALQGKDGEPLLDDKGNYQRNKVLGLHVMRREKDFGEAYRQNRSGEWEYVEYRTDGSYITPPQESFSCAKCHIKAGKERDFVYRGRLPADAGK